MNRKSHIINILKCTLLSFICGSIVGLIIFAFKFMASRIEEISIFIYNNSKKNPFLILLVFIALLLLAFVMRYLHKKIPETKGGGIPRSEGVLRGILPMKPVRTFLGTIFGSFISYLVGLPLGTEGPSVIIGTSVGDAVSKCTKNKALDRYIQTGGAASGFAVATGAPLSGILFSLEEIHKRFTPMLVIAASISTVSATLVNALLCSQFNISAKLFSIEIFSSFELRHVLYLIPLSILIALSVGVFDKVLEVVNKLTAKYKYIFKPLYKLIFIFLLTGILAYIFDDGIYSGHHLIEDIISGKKEIGVLFILLFVRLLLMFIVANSNATGGIFIPVLAIACIIGAIFSNALIFIGMEEKYFAVIVLLTMCAFIGGTLRAPFTATVLFLELSGSFTDLFYVVLVIFIVNFITEIFNQPSFYDRALEKMEKEKNDGKVAKIALFEVKISPNSFVCEKSVRDIMWPHSSVVISVKRHKEDFIDTDNDGEKKLHAKDTIVIRARYYDEDEIKDSIVSLVGNEYEIKII